MQEEQRMQRERRHARPGVTAQHRLLAPRVDD